MFSFKTVAYEMWITEFFFLTQDTDIIIDRIKKSTRELEQGPIGKKIIFGREKRISCQYCMYVQIAYYVSNSNDDDT